MRTGVRSPRPKIGELAHQAQGFDELADGMRNTILDFAAKNEDGIYEKYDADTGEGKGCPCFSRSSAFVMEFILDFL